MSTRRVTLLLAVAALAASAAFAQAAPATGAKGATGAKAASGAKAATGGTGATQPAAGKPEAEAPKETGANTIDQILEGEEDVLQGNGYTYDPGTRRDPFKSLLVAQDKAKAGGPRPPGIPGLLIDELDVTGVFHTSKGWVAQVQAGSKEKSYLIKEGDQLFDGDVVSISRGEVVFKQIVNDPTALKPFREVVKKLNP
jgi:hypothetical protein